MVKLELGRLIVPVWVVVVGLVAVFQPPETIGASVLLLLVIGIVAPTIWFIVLSWRQHALAGRSERRRK